MSYRRLSEEEKLKIYRSFVTKITEDKRKKYRGDKYAAYRPTLYVDKYGDVWHKINETTVKRLKDGNMGVWDGGKGFSQ